MLSFLGFEDLDEFKAIYKDVADLFVEKTGYIYKFKNFSWIEYTLHSGTPNKNVMITLKNSQVIESELKIKEIYLINELGGSSKFYSVEFINSFFNNQSSEDFQPAISPKTVDTEAMDLLQKSKNEYANTQETKQNMANLTPIEENPPKEEVPKEELFKPLETKEVQTQNEFQTKENDSDEDDFYKLLEEESDNDKSTESFLDMDEQDPSLFSDDETTKETEEDFFTKTFEDNKKDNKENFFAQLSEPEDEKQNEEEDFYKLLEEESSKKDTEPLSDTEEQKPSIFSTNEIPEIKIKKDEEKEEEEEKEYDFFAKSFEESEDEKKEDKEDDFPPDFFAKFNEPVQEEQNDKNNEEDFYKLLQEESQDEDTNSVLEQNEQETPPLFDDETPKSTTEEENIQKDIDFSSIFDTKKEVTTKESKIKTKEDNRQSLSFNLDDTEKKAESNKPLKDTFLNLITKDKTEEKDLIQPKNFSKNFKLKKEMRKDRPKEENIQTLSIKESFETLGISDDEEKELIEDFINDINKNTVLIQKYIVNKNYTKIADILNIIKSAANILNIKEIANKVETMHTLLDNNEIDELLRETKEIEEHGKSMQEALYGNSI